MIRHIKYIFYLIIPLCVVHPLFSGGPQPQLGDSQEHTKTDFEIQQEYMNGALRALAKINFREDLDAAGKKFIEELNKRTPKMSDEFYNNSLSPAIKDFNTNLRDLTITCGFPALGATLAIIKCNPAGNISDPENKLALATLIAGVAPLGIKYCYEWYTGKNNKPQIQKSSTNGERPNPNKR